MPITPEQAENFYEDDQDPAEIFARFDAAPKLATTAPESFAARQVRQGREYIQRAYGDEREPSAYEQGGVIGG